MKRLAQIPLAIGLVAIGGTAFAQQAPVSGPPAKPHSMEEARKRMSWAAGYYWYSTMRSTFRGNTDPLGVDMAIRTALTDGASVTSVGLDVTVTRPFSMLAPYPCHIPMTSGSASFRALRYVYCIEWWLPKSQRQFAIEHGSTSQAASE